MLSFVGERFGPPAAFRLVETEVPPPAEGEVRLRVEATALGFVDGLLIEGKYQIKPPLPYVPGGEIAGTVDAVGRGVSHLRPGDRVVTWQLGGGLSHFAIAPADAVERLPDGLDLEIAAAVLVDYQTAHYALFERGQLRAGELVLIHGAAGGVGAAAVQLAVGAGARVIAAVSTPEKATHALRTGAHAAISSAGPGIRDAIRDVVLDGVVDMIVDPVGGPNFEALFRSLAKEGRHLVIGFAGGPVPSLPANLPLLKSAALVGVDVRHFLTARPNDARRARAALFRRIVAGELSPPPILRFPLTQADAAFEALKGRERLGKVVVLPHAP